MGNGITGAPQNFLNMANKVQNTGVFGTEYNDTIVAENGKPLHGHDFGIFTKIKDMFNATFRPETHAKNLQDRQNAIKAGAQQIFDAMKRDYGESFAKSAFKAVGSGHSTGHGQPYSADRVTGGQLLQLQNIAYKFDTHVAKEYSQELLLSQTRLHDAVSIKLHDGATQRAGGNPLPEDHPDVTAFREKAAAVFDTFIQKGSKYEINISYAVRNNILGRCGDDSANIATMSTADLIALQKDLESARNQNEALIGYSKARFVAGGPGKDAFESPMIATWYASAHHENAGPTFNQKYTNQEAERLQQQAAAQAQNEVAQNDPMFDLEPPSRLAPTPEEYGATT
ncbi:MAG: hypothetical protein AAGJ53_09000, partial [Pseudomonadota bacterium]